MTRNEFLERLRKALENELNGPAIQENVDYYNSYITEEMQRGRTETEVTAELGDPWVIARSLIEAAENAEEAKGSSQSYDAPREREGRGQGYSSAGKNIRVFGFDTWWKRLLLVLGIIGVVLIVAAVIGGIFSLLMPILIPVLFIMLVVRMMGRRR